MPNRLASTSAAIAQGHAQIVGVPQHRDRADIRHRLLEERQTLR